MGPFEPRSRAHYFWIAGAGAVGSGLLVLGLATPSASGTGTHVQFGLPPCVSMEFLGVPCPGCGVTTSVALAADGRLADSLRNQPFGFALAACSAAFVLWALWAQLSGRDLHEHMRRLNRRWVYVSSALLFVAAWVYKLAVTVRL